MDGIFGRRLNGGNVAIFHDDGQVVTHLDANVYPVGSSLSARYDHPDGIVLSPADAARLGVELEE